MAWIQFKSEQAHLDKLEKHWKKKKTHVLVFHQTNCKIQPAADTEGQLCKDGSQEGRGTREDDKYKRFTGPGSVSCTVEIVLDVLLSRWAS